VAAQDRDDTPDQNPDVGGTPPAEFVGPPRPVALTPLARKVRRSRSRSPSPSFLQPGPVRTAIGVIAGLLLLFAVTVLYVRTSHRAAAAATAKAAAQAQEQAERDERQRAEAAQRAQAERERLAAEQEQARIARAREQQVLADQAQAAARGEAERKQRAWEAYYRKPPGCTDAASLECANHYIRARRAFDEKYAKGQL
jgi:hypothetical protein